MSTVGKRADPNDLRNSFSAATFRKVLKGFEIGGLPYTEVQFQLKRLLATGVSPGELREVLRRSELIEPLPEYAYREVLGLLNEAIEQDAALQSGPDGAVDPAAELDPAVLAAELRDARSGLESEQTRARGAEEALSASIAAEQALRSRLDTALRELERHQAELRTSRNSMASRDKVTAQMRQALDERDAELAAARREHAELRQSLAQRESQLDELKRERTDTLAALESHATNAARLQADLQAACAQAAAARAELDAVRAALDSERRELSASHGNAVAELRQTLAQRDAQLDALRRERADTLTSLESRVRSAAQLQADLQAARAQAAASQAELDAARGALDSERRESSASHGKAVAEMRQTLAQRDALVATLRQGHSRAIGESEEKLQAAQKRAAAATSDLEGLRVQVADLQLKIRDSDAQIEKLNASLRSETKRAARMEVPPRAPAAPAAALRSRLGFYATPRTAWIAAATVLLGASIWFVIHRLSPLPSSPAASTAASIQPDAAVLPTEPLNPGSAPETGPTVEKPPRATTTPAGTPLTAAAKPNSDLRRCRAGGIDACYDAIRWKPSDPALLSALGDALLRANRPTDALRTYRRVATLAPNTPGLAAKISAIEAKLSAKRAPARASAHTAAADVSSGTRYPSAAAETQSR